MSNPQVQYRETVFDALPGTIAQIVQRTGVGRATVYKWLTALRAADRCFVKSWRRTEGRYCPRFAAGCSTDAPLPAPLSGAEHSRKHYVKHRKPIETELRAVRKAARENASRMAKAPQSWMSALMGAA